MKHPKNHTLQPVLIVVILVLFTWVCSDSFAQLGVNNALDSMTSGNRTVPAKPMGNPSEMNKNESDIADYSRFKKMDIDGDGMISPSELMENDKNNDELFAHCDINNDGHLSPFEMQSYWNVNSNRP